MENILYRSCLLQTLPSFVIQESQPFKKWHLLCVIPVSATMGGNLICHYSSKTKGLQNCFDNLSQQLHEDRHLTLCRTPSKMISLCVPVKWMMEWINERVCVNSGILPQQPQILGLCRHQWWELSRALELTHHWARGQERGALGFFKMKVLVCSHHLRELPRLCCRLCETTDVCVS